MLKHLVIAKVLCIMNKLLYIVKTWSLDLEPLYYNSLVLKYISSNFFYQYNFVIIISKPLFVLISNFLLQCQSG